MSATAGTSALGVVDAHVHIVVGDLFEGPDALDPAVAELRTVEGRRRLFTRGRELTSVLREFVDPVRMAAEARETGVDHLLLSPWIQLAPLGRDAEAARRLCQAQNAALARIVASEPERFSAVGAVPVEHPRDAAAVLEAACAAGLVGAEIPASACDYLGDASLEPFWGTAEELRAIVLVHPGTRGIAVHALDEYYLWNTVGNPTETAIAGAHLALAGVLERHPDLRVVLAHGGGSLPSLRGRLAHGQRAVPGARGQLSEPVEASLARFYFDTITHDRRALRRLVADFGATRVLLGSDRPFDMGDPDPVATVRGLGLGTKDEQALLGGNAARLIAAVRR
jgi:aminocarboxymuconate-semialdehyde decarboxylase